jgi:hypothetical protein
VEEGADDDEAARRALTLIVTTEEKAVAVDQLISTLWGSGNLRRWQAEEATISDAEQGDEPVGD